MVKKLTVVVKRSKIGRGSRRGNQADGVDICEVDGVGGGVQAATPRPREASPLAGSCTSVTLK